MSEDLKRSPQDLKAAGREAHRCPKKKPTSATATKGDATTIHGSGQVERFATVGAGGETEISRSQPADPRDLSPTRSLPLAIAA